METSRRPKRCQSTSEVMRKKSCRKGARGVGCWGTQHVMVMFTCDTASHSSRLIPTSIIRSESMANHSGTGMKPPGSIPRRGRAWVSIGHLVGRWEVTWGYAHHKHENHERTALAVAASVTTPPRDQLLRNRYPGSEMLGHPAPVSDVYTCDTASRPSEVIAPRITR